MHFSLEGISIESLAYAEPPDVVTSEEIENRLASVYERLKLPAGRLELMTGILERRFWPAGTLPSAASAAAGEKALAVSDIKRDHVDVLIHCGVCRDRLEPATASSVHRLLGLSQSCQTFDLSNACLGMLNGFLVAGSMIRSGMAKCAMVVSGENGRPLLERTIRTLLESNLSRREIKPYFANLTIGAGACAALLCSADMVNDGKLRLGKGVVMSDSSASELCQGESAGDELAMMTDSEALLEAGVALASKTWSGFAGETGWTTDTPDHVICHQVGRRHQMALFEALDLDLSKDFSSYETWGNVGSVSLPLTLAKAKESGALQTGQKAALLGIGSGLVCMMLETTLL
ncbi:3-oxoacyl-ACP synthase III [Rubellicoccus peritrichatus]|uniref:3-oxoacyl-ACP synthase III n=1 Tax=Rubellicoccus peritrichatus TaxID=3080537 RepID=A0AAQ3L557_9BACT|nr:3-oxoacyl-ACP synthase III [Puniceicoccus sp. CR14]WOO39584.1 3-oxoacyl-ACP synthase III [Puniceicoccus sp. CR14]